MVLKLKGFEFGFRFWCVAEREAADAAEELIAWPPLGHIVLVHAARVTCCFVNGDSLDGLWFVFGIQIFLVASFLGWRQRVH